MRSSSPKFAIIDELSSKSINWPGRVGPSGAGLKGSTSDALNSEYAASLLIPFLGFGAASF